MSRGPKQRTAQNARRGVVGKIRHETLEAPISLSAPAQSEFDRLVGVLAAKGTLDRVDLAVVAECARVSILLDHAYADVEGKPTWAQAKLVGLLTTQRRGLLRELGLTIKPSNTVFKTNPIGSERDEKAPGWASKLKVS